MLPAPCCPTQWTCHALAPAVQVSTWFTCPGGIEGWVDFAVGYILRWFTGPQRVTHPSNNHLITTQPGVVRPAFWPLHHQATCTWCVLSVWAAAWADWWLVSHCWTDVTPARWQHVCGWCLQPAVVTGTFHSHWLPVFSHSHTAHPLTWLLSVLVLSERLCGKNIFFTISICGIMTSPLNFILLENLIIVRKLSLKNKKTIEAENPPFWEILGAELKFWALTHNLLCRKFAAVCLKIATSCPAPSLFNARWLLLWR